MTVPAIPFKFSNIQAEFGSNMPTTASNFFAYKKWYNTSTGGYYVGVTNSTTNISTGTPNLLMSSFANEAATYIANTVTYTTATTTSVIIPSGVKNITIEVWGGSGGAGLGQNPFSGGGGGSGGYSSSTYAISGTNWGQTFNVRVGLGGSRGTSTSPAIPGTGGGPSTVTNGTFNITLNMVAPGGGGGASGTGLPLTGGTAGNSGTGGQVNKLGAVGSNGTSGGVAPGGAGVVGQYGVGPTGGTGVVGPTPGGTGVAGLVIFHYS